VITAQEKTEATQTAVKEKAVLETKEETKEETPVEEQVMEEDKEEEIPLEKIPELMEQGLSAFALKDFDTAQDQFSRALQTL
jgi:hypothetical protein